MSAISGAAAVARLSTRTGEQWFAVMLAEDMGQTTRGEAEGVLLGWRPAQESYHEPTADALADLGKIVLVDPFGLFATATRRQRGYARPRQGDDRIVYELVQLEC